MEKLLTEILNRIEDLGEWRARCRMLEEQLETQRALNEDLSQQLMELGAKYRDRFGDSVSDELKRAIGGYK